MTARPRISAQAYQKECRDLGRPVPGFLLGKDAAGHVAPHEAVQTIMQQLSANGDLGHFAAPVVPGPSASDRVQCIFSASRL